ncbi:hypothetical protein HA402_012746 [Bradysia odoriphaga]|nr:hypothetical protein HA402_012746 [Bradysia odoriphaga]
MISLTNGHSEEWYRGKIYSVEVKDFVTYDHVLYYPGQYLNIIVGPNGTGKSTLVAAIVLGMGGTPKVLSRSQNIEDYVKNGKQCAAIEMVLLRDAKRKSKFKRTFNINGQNKYYVDDTECSNKKYLEYVAQFNIQITNLCQFLPQDRVQDFAKMNPQELLHNTQTSVCSPECSAMFEKLKDLRSQQKGDGSALIAQINKLNEHEGKIAGLKEQVDNIKLKTNLSEQLDICNKKKAWMEFEELFIKFKEIEADLKKGNDNKKRVEDELAPLTEQASHINRLKQVHQTNIKSEADKASKFSTELNKLDEKTCKCEEAIVKAEGDLKFAKQSNEENKKELESALVKQRALLEDVKRAVAVAGSEEDKKIQLEEIKKERIAHVEKIRSLTEGNRQVVYKLNEEINPRLRSIDNKIKQMENSKNVKLELLRSRFNDVYKGVMWLRQNQSRFRGKVYEPMILEVTNFHPIFGRSTPCTNSTLIFQLNVREGYAKYFENLIPIRDVSAFMCENKDDMEKLFKCLRTDMKLEVNIISVKPVRALRTFIAVNIRNQSIRLQLLSTRIANHRFSSRRSKYSNEISSQCTEITGKNLLNVAIDLGALENFKLQRDEVIRQSDRYRNEQGKIEVDIKEHEVKINDLDQRKGQIDKNFYNIDMYRRNLLRQMKVVENLNSSIVDLDKENEKFVKKCAETIQTLTTMQKQKTETVKKLKDAVLTAECHRKKQRIFLRSTAELENRIQEAQEKLNQAIRFVNNIKTALEQAKEKCKKQQALASQLTDNKKPSDARNFPYKKQFDELPDTMDELVDHMNEIQGQMECVRNYNPEVITEYENLVSEDGTLKERNRSGPAESQQFGYANGFRSLRSGATSF